MDFNIDSFIDYSDVSHEIDSSSPLDSNKTRGVLFSESPVTTDPQGNLLSPFPELTNSLTNSTYSPALSNDSLVRAPVKLRPFRIIRTVNGTTEGEEDEQNAIMPQTKKIHKRDKAKLIAKTKQETAFLLSNAASKYIPPKFDDPVVDLKTKRRMIQLVKNRVAAQKTRDTRKLRFVNIQEEKERVDEENRRLNEQNASLLAKIRELEEAQKRLLTENEILKKSKGIESNISIESVLGKSPERELQESQGTFEDDNLFRELQSPLILSRRSSGVSRTSRNSNICFTKFFALTIIIASFYSLRITKIHPIKLSGGRLAEQNTKYLELITKAILGINMLPGSEYVEYSENIKPALQKGHNPGESLQKMVIVNEELLRSYFYSSDFVKLNEQSDSFYSLYGEMIRRAMIQDINPGTIVPAQFFSQTDEKDEGWISSEFNLDVKNDLMSDIDNALQLIKGSNILYELNSEDDVVAKAEEEVATVAHKRTTEYFVENTTVEVMVKADTITHVDVDSNAETNSECQHTNIDVAVDANVGLNVEIDVNIDDLDLKGQNIFMDIDIDIDIGIDEDVGLDAVVDAKIEETNQKIQDIEVEIETEIEFKIGVDVTMEENTDECEKDQFQVDVNIDLEIEVEVDVDVHNICNTEYDEEEEEEEEAEEEADVEIKTGVEIQDTGLDVAMYVNADFNVEIDQNLDDLELKGKDVKLDIEFDLGVDTEVDIEKDKLGHKNIEIEVEAEAEVEINVTIDVSVEDKTDGCEQSKIDVNVDIDTEVEIELHVDIHNICKEVCEGEEEEGAAEGDYLQEMDINAKVEGTAINTHADSYNDMEEKKYLGDSSGDKVISISREDVKASDNTDSDFNSDMKMQIVLHMDRDNAEKIWQKTKDEEDIDTSYPWNMVSTEEIPLIYNATLNNTNKFKALNFSIEDKPQLKSYDHTVKRKNSTNHTHEINPKISVGIDDANISVTPYDGKNKYDGPCNTVLELEDHKLEINANRSNHNGTEIRNESNESIDIISESSKNNTNINLRAHEYYYLNGSVINKENITKNLKEWSLNDVFSILLENCPAILEVEEHKKVHDLELDDMYHETALEKDIQFKSSSKDTVKNDSKIQQIKDASVIKDQEIILE